MPYLFELDGKILGVNVGDMGLKDFDPMKHHYPPGTTCRFISYEEMINLVPPDPNNIGLPNTEREDLNTLEEHHGLLIEVLEDKFKWPTGSIKAEIATKKKEKMK